MEIEEGIIQEVHTHIVQAGTLSLQLSQSQEQIGRLLCAEKNLRAIQSAPQPLQKLFWASKVRKERQHQLAGTELMHLDVPMPDIGIRYATRWCLALKALRIF